MSSTQGLRRSKRKGAENTVQRGVKRLKTHLHATPQGSASSTAPPPSARSTCPDEQIPAGGPSTVTNPVTIRGGTSAKSKATATTGLESVLQALHISADVIPPLKPAIGGLVSCLDAVQAATTNAEDYNELTSELNTMAHTLREYLEELSSEDSDDNPKYSQIASSIEAEAANIRNRQNRGKVRRAFMSAEDRDSIIQHYRRVEGLFRQLLSDISLQTLKSVNKQHAAILLQEMSPVDEARYNSSYSITIKRRGCTKQTREHIQTTLQDWAQNPDGARIYWMNGMAGTGKTTIAYSLCEWLEANGKLGASFFCSRASLSCQKVDLVIPTIAYELARYSAEFRVALTKILKNIPETSKLKITTQFKKLVLDPILAIDPLALGGTVVVIDALDECENDTGVQLILKTLLEPRANLPLKFFVTNRPEPIIYKEMTSLAGYSPAVLHLHDIEQSIVEEDIEKYLTEAFDPMSPSPSNDQIRQLAKQSGKLFIYAATAVRYILPGKAAVNSVGRLAAILSTNPRKTRKGTSNKKYKPLDELYTAILATAFDEELEEMEAKDLRLVLWTVICAQEPMAISTIASLLSLAKEQVMSMLEPLRSVLHISESTELVSTLHASFLDYMLDRSRSKKFRCKQSHHNKKLADGCFRIMKELLHFNICHLNSSFIRDKEVKDLDQRIARYIPPVLSYACRYWSEHLRIGGEPDSLRSEVADFLQFRLLFWMEVLNLSGLLGDGSVALRSLINWLLMREASEDHIVRIRDTRTGKIVAEPSEGCRNLAWPIVISPDRTRIATSRRGFAIQMWDARTGTPLADPFKGHTGQITSIAFSPDGTRIASGSADATIRVWNASTGEAIAKPLRGHRDLIYSVSFSLDGMRLASCSDDKATVVWDIDSGKPLDVAVNREATVRTVAFSPNGSCFLSRSSGSVVVRDARTGGTVAGPLGSGPHAGGARRVAFSPDSKRLVCSFDDAIRVWDLHTDPENVRLGKKEWLRDKNGLLLHIPREMFRSHIPCPQGTVLLGRDGPVLVDYENLFMGERWAECFVP